MKSLLGALLACVGSLAFADIPAPAHMGATAGVCTAETLKQLERDWADAERTGDSDKIDRILADDWTGVSSEGKKLTKDQLLKEIKSGKLKTMSVEFGPMDVKVLGDVAVVQGSDVERNKMNGQYISGEEVWTDVFANRDGKWVVVRSQSAQTEADWRPRFPI